MACSGKCIVQLGVHAQHAGGCLVGFASGIVSDSRRVDTCIVDLDGRRAAIDQVSPSAPEHRS